MEWEQAGRGDRGVRGAYFLRGNLIL